MYNYTSCYTCVTYSDIPCPHNIHVVKKDDDGIMKFYTLILHVHV